MKHGVVERTGQ